MRRKRTKILEAMWKQKLTQSELCKLAEISSEARLSRIINFQVEPTSEELQRLSKALRVWIGVGGRNES